MTITQTDIENFEKKIGMAKRNVAPSAASVTEELLNFICDVDVDIFNSVDKKQLATLFDDLEYDEQHQNEGKLKAKKSSTAARITSRKWYKQNKGRVAKLQMKLKKSKGKLKKQKIMAKSQRALNGKKKKHYNTSGHETAEASNYGFAEYITENNIGVNSDVSLDFKMKRDIRDVVKKWFSNTPYRVIKSFSIGDGIEAVLNEKIEHVCGGTWVLTKRNGNRYRLFVADNKFITPYIKHEKDITVEDMF